VELAFKNSAYKVIVEHQGWHYLVWVSSLLFAGVAFLDEKFLKIEAFEEDIQNYKIMYSIFKEIQALLANSKLDENSRGIELELGSKVMISCDTRECLKYL
jgi:hypothetical protein